MKLVPASASHATCRRSTTHCEALPSGMRKRGSVIADQFPIQAVVPAGLFGVFQTELLALLTPG